MLGMGQMGRSTRISCLQAEAPRQSIGAEVCAEMGRSDSAAGQPRPFVTAQVEA